MSNQSPTSGHDRGPDELREPEPDERDADQEQHQNKGHGPLKGTDTPATTNAEDMEKAKRTTM
jgi:hypothetical protein